jgi:5'-deoxynucleotidase YfbR-like HD superfamily hydrolase
MNNSETQSEKEQAMGAEMKKTIGSELLKVSVGDDYEFVKNPSRGQVETCADCGGRAVYRGEVIGWQHLTNSGHLGVMRCPSEKKSASGTIAKGLESYDWDTFKALRRMRDVHRLSGFFTTRVYTDAEHCYYTGLLFVQMAHAHKVNINQEMIVWVFTHDALEVATGDLLYPTKNLNRITKGAWATIEKEVSDSTPSLKGYADVDGMRLLGIEAWNLFKACDALELWFCCIEEWNRSNTLVNLDGRSVEETMYACLKDCPFEYIREAVRR